MSNFKVKAQEKYFSRRTSQKLGLVCLFLSTLLVRQTLANEGGKPNGTKEISEMNILLPVSLCENLNSPECRTAKHELFAYNGCYKWDISHPHLVKMTPAKQHGTCIDSVILEPLVNRDSKTLIWIQATDKKSQVKLGKIDRIAININYKHLYVNDKKHVDVIAFDDEGGIFSGLTGFRFNWNLLSGSQFLKIIPKPEGYLHTKANGTEVAFVRGLEAGSAELSVEILEPVYDKNIQSVQVTLLVVDPFVIEPSKPIFIAPTSSFKFSLSKLNKKDTGVVDRSNIKLPSPQYLWSVQDNILGEISQDGTFKSKVTEGKQDIFVVDQKMVNNTAETLINVVYPYRVQLKLKDITSQQNSIPSLSDSGSYYQQMFGQSTLIDSDTNILVENRVYLIQLTLFDKDENQITLTDNLKFETTGLFASESIRQLRVNKIGSEVVFQTNKITEEQVKIGTSHKLKEISRVNGEEYQVQNKTFLIVDVEFILTKQVEIINPTDLILLPFIQNGQTWKVSAKGGSGVYDWSVENPQIASVEGSAIVKSIKLGKTKLILKDHKNVQNFVTMDIEVAVVNQLKWLEEHLELKSQNSLETGESSLISIIALDRAGRKFSNCSSLETSFTIKGESNLQELPVESSYSTIFEYVNDNQVFGLLWIKQKFDENQQKFYYDDTLKGQTTIPKDMMIHNNFGICSQTVIQAGLEGLGRVKALSKIITESNQQKILESEFAEVAVYKQLSTLAPDVSKQFDRLYSNSQIGQEFVNFDSFYAANKVTLMAGTQATWIVSGGSNFWQDYQGKYQVESKIISRNQDSNTETIKLHQQTEEITKNTLRIHCLPSQDNNKMNKVTIEMTQSSRLSRQLLRPAQHKISLDVDCGAPKHQRILWTQRNDLVESNLPNSRQVQNERVHFVLQGSQHTLETIFFDENLNAFYNSSSLISKVTSSDSNLASVDYIDRLHTEAVSNQRYAKREVHFGNKTGSVTIKSVTTGYQKSLVGLEDSYSPFKREEIKDDSVWKMGTISQFTTPLSDQLKIEVVKNIEIEPKYKSIYVGSTKEFKFTILEGSGHFSVSLSDPDLVQMTHKEREISILPNRVGNLEIQVEDLLLPDAQTRTVQVLISDIESIFLWSEHSLIEEGNKMNLTVIAFDSSDNEFDADQYVDMKFDIETEATGIDMELGLRTESTKQNTEFVANGNTPGIYQLTAISLKQNSESRKVVVSEMLKVEVFPLLEIFPSELLLTPNMRYTVQFVGGPQSSVLSYQNGSSVEIKFEIEESSVASVDINREVTGLSIGNAVLKYQILQQRSQRLNNIRLSKSQQEQSSSKIISKKQIPIRVRLVTDVQIPQAHQRQIYSNSLIKLNVVLKHGDEYFTQGIAPISYSWNCSQSQVLNLELPSNSDNLPTGTTNGFLQKTRKIRNNQKKDDNALFNTGFNSSTIYASAGKEGDAPVNVVVAIEYPTQYKSEQNWFYSTAVVKVASRLVIQVNEFSTGSHENTHMFLLPPNSIGHIKANINTKLKLGYSIVSVFDRSTNTVRSEEASSPLVKLVDNKAIQTFEKYGKVTVIVEQGGQAFSDQVAMLNVFITDIYSLQVMESYDAMNMALGSTLQLPIHFQNEHANRFALNIEGPQIAYSISHPKVVHVEIDSYKQTMTLTSIGQGDCNIVLYLKNNPQIYDILKIRVQSIVRPLSPVNIHIGGEVFFKVINPDDTNQVSVENSEVQTNWQSADSQILTIDSETGKALGKSEGHTEVILSNHVNAASLVHVGRIQYGQIEHRNPLVLNTDEKYGQKSPSSIQDTLRVRVKLYFTKDGEEVMPTYQYSGITLIKQNIGITCATNQTDHLKVEAEISDVEGYFCVITYKKNSNHRSMPRFAKIVVSVFSLSEGQQVPTYSTEVASFEVQLLSSIKVENKFASGIKLSGSQRQEKVHVFSSSDFNVQIIVDNEETNDLLKYKVTREDLNSNDYSLTLIVPSEVNQDFKANVVLIHPYTKFEKILPVQFSSVDNIATQKPVKKPTQQKQQEPQYEGMSQSKSLKGTGASYKTYLIYFGVVVVSLVFLLQHFFQISVFVSKIFSNQQFQNLGGQQRDRNAVVPNRQRPIGMSDGRGVREPNRSFPVKSQSSFQNAGSAYDDSRRRGYDLDRYSQRRSGAAVQQSGGNDQSRQSIYTDNLFSPNN